jgi:hypothetical protein
VAPGRYVSEYMEWKTSSTTTTTTTTTTVAVAAYHEK